MRLRILGLAAVFAALALLTARPAEAQGLSSLAAASAVAGAATVEKQPGCWGCGSMLGLPYCQGGWAPGYFNCSATIMNTCRLTSPGCGEGAALPVDPDGAAQYVSRGSLLNVVASADGSPPTRQNCEGVVVARSQSPDDIMTVRSRTGSLTL
jgi:hypothetical protein